MVRIARACIFILGVYGLLVVAAGLATEPWLGERALSREPWALLAGALYILAHISITIVLDVFASRNKGDAEAYREQAVSLFGTVAAFAIIGLVGTFLYAIGLSPNTAPALLRFIDQALPASLPEPVDLVIKFGAYLAVFSWLSFQSLKMLKVATRPLELKALESMEAEAAHAEEEASKADHLKDHAKSLRKVADWRRNTVVLQQEGLRGWAHFLFAVQLFLMFPAAIQIADLAEVLFWLLDWFALVVGAFALLMVLATLSELRLKLEGERPEVLERPEPPFTESEFRNDNPKIIDDSEDQWRRYMFSAFVFLLLPLAIGVGLHKFSIIEIPGLWAEYAPPDEQEVPARPTAEIATPAPAVPDKEEPQASHQVDPATEELPLALIRPLAFDRSMPVWRLDSATEVVTETGRLTALSDWAGQLDARECTRVEGLIAVGLASHEGAQDYNLALSRSRAVEIRRFALDRWTSLCANASPPIQIVVARGAHRDIETPSDPQRRVVVLAIERGLTEKLLSPDELLSAGEGNEALGTRYLNCEALPGAREPSNVSGASLCATIFGAQHGS